MHIKVYNGSTDNSAASLCDSCRHATITRGRRLNEEIVRCEAATMRPVLVTFKVTSCTAFVDATELSYGQLLLQAWILRPGSAKRPAGFVRGSELAPHEFHAFLNDVQDAD